VPDAVFTNPRLAEIYDDLDGERRDLDHDVACVDEFGARSVLDIGCGTGALAIRLAGTGVEVTGVDPARASLAVARRKPGADGVRWLLGDATAVPSLTADPVTMTGNVAQVFLTDAEWHATLRACRRALGAGGRLVFETRDPSFRGWAEWTPSASRSIKDTVHGPVVSWVELIGTELPLVSFRWTFRFVDDDAVVTSVFTLCFRTRSDVERSLRRCGFHLDEVRDAPDRPGREFVFIARSM
jgi:SAM-dependent methyltransferase